MPLSTSSPGTRKPPWVTIRSASAAGSLPSANPFRYVWVCGHHEPPCRRRRARSESALPEPMCVGIVIRCFHPHGSSQASSRQRATVSAAGTAPTSSDSALRPGHLRSGGRTGSTQSDRTGPPASSRTSRATSSRRERSPWWAARTAKANPVDNSGACSLSDLAIHFPHPSHCRLFMSHNSAACRKLVLSRVSHCDLRDS